MEPTKEEFEALKKQLAELTAKKDLPDESNPVEPEVVEESADLVTTLITTGSEVVEHWIDKKSETDKYVADRQEAIAEKKLITHNKMHKRDSTIKLVLVSMAVIALVVLSITGSLGDASIAILSVLIASAFGNPIKSIFQQSKE